MTKKLCVLLIYLALALSTLMVFWQVRHHDFISIDDDLYIVENSHVKAGLNPESIVWAWTEAHANNWHPLTWMSHMLDSDLYGLEPGGHHFSNLLFHVTNALLLLFVLHRTTGNLWSSVFVASVFALHPLHVESVAWASERKDVLSALFWILTIWYYIRYAERPGIKRYLTMVLVFALGLTAKQMLVTLPFVLLLLDYWPLGRLAFKEQRFCISSRSIVPASLGRCILEKLPLLILSSVAGVVIYLIQQSTGMVKSITQYPLSDRAGNAIVSYISYIGKMVWPSQLAFFYPHPHGNLAVWRVMGASLFLVCITATALWGKRKYPYLFVGWLWYLVTLLPVIGLVQIGEHALADRYTYLPSIGIFIIVAWGVPDLFAKWRYRRITLGVSMVTVVLALSICTYLQVGHWRNTVTLFEHTIEVTEDNYLAHASLGSYLLVEGQVDKGIAHSYEALRISPNYAEVHLNLGAALLRQGNYSQAITHCYKAIQIMPDLAVAHKNLGSAFLQQGELDEAIRHLTKALSIEPGLAGAHSDLGYSLARKGKDDDAVKHFAEAIRLKPDWIDPMNNLAWLLAADKEAEFHNPAEAIRLAERVCELTDYKQPGAMDTLAAAYAAGGRFSDAVTTAEKALELAQSLQQTELIEEIQNRLLLYKAGKPYIELSPVLN